MRTPFCCAEERSTLLVLMPNKNPTARGGILICVWRFTFIEKDAVRGIRPWRRLTALSHLSKLPCSIRLNANPILLRRGALGSSRSYAKQKSHRYGWDFVWRRKRDSNPRAFWANGFQDRLVMTASIFLHIIMHFVAL